MSYWNTHYIFRGRKSMVLYRGLKRNIFTLNIHYSQPTFREYSLFFAYFETNIHYSFKKRLMFPGTQFLDPQKERGQISYIVAKIR